MINQIYCPQCGRLSNSSDAFCGQCRHALKKHVAIMNDANAQGIPVQGQPSLVSAAAPQTVLASPIGGSTLLGLWPHPQTTGEWILWLAQGIAPFGALLVMLLSFLNWSTTIGQNDFWFRLISGLLGFITFGVWAFFTLYRNIWKNPRGWIAATGCLASPAILIVSLAGAFTIVSVWGASKSLSYISLTVCISGLLPFAAVMYFVMRGKRAK